MELKLNETQVILFADAQSQIEDAKAKLTEREQDLIEKIMLLTGDKDFKNPEIKGSVLYWESSKEAKVDTIEP